MNKQEYREYLASKQWLLKKHALISVYLKEGWSIDCIFCGSEKYLQVHHLSYANIGNEIVTDERIWDLVFACKDCHYKYHFQKGFKEAWLKQSFDELISSLPAA
jgi:hypothetical protein